MPGKQTIAAVPLVASHAKEVIDIVKLNAEIREIVAREQVLRDEIDKIIAEIEVY